MKQLSIFLVVFVGATLEFQVSHASNVNSAEQRRMFAKAMEPSFIEKLSVLCRAVGMASFDLYNATDEELRQRYSTSDKAKRLEDIILMKRQPEFQKRLATLDSARQNPDVLNKKLRQNLKICTDEEASKKNALRVRFELARNAINKKSGRQ